MAFLFFIFFSLLSSFFISLSPSFIILHIVLTRVFLKMTMIMAGFGKTCA